MKLSDETAVQNDMMSGNAGHMRRIDREITSHLEIESILADATVCRIGLAVNDEPYVVPVSFSYEQDDLPPFSNSRKKISMLKKNSRCCFELDQYDNILLEIARVHGG
jgi:hypothetical protein